MGVFNLLRVRFRLRFRWTTRIGEADGMRIGWNDNFSDICNASELTPAIVMTALVYYGRRNRMDSLKGLSNCLQGGFADLFAIPSSSVTESSARAPRQIHLERSIREVG